MASAERVLEVARGELGYCPLSDPEPGSKYARWYESEVEPGEKWLLGPSTEIAWCCLFVSWVLAKAGVVSRGFPSYNTDLVLYYLPKTVPYEQTMPGDLVIWDWNGDGATDHIGIVERIGDYELTTIEGNHAHRVELVDRSSSLRFIRCVIRPDYAKDSAFSGSWDAPTISKIQKWLKGLGYYHGIVDGVFDPGYSMTIAAFQKFLNDAGV